MEAFGNGAVELADLARRVNRSPEALASELARLAQVPPKAAAARTMVADYDAARALRPARSAAAGDGRRNANAASADVRYTQPVVYRRRPRPRLATRRSA